MGELHASGSIAKPDHFHKANTKSVEMAAPEDEVDGFLSPKQEKE